MRKALGLTALLIVLVALVCAWEFIHTGTVKFVSQANLRNVLTSVGLFGVLSLAQSLVIITGGIDLSVGSLIALTSISCAMLLDKGAGYDPRVVIPAILIMGAGIGAWHGLLITKARMQPFVVTLCGLFVYRGLARLIADDNTQGFGSAFDDLREYGNGFYPRDDSLLPQPFLIFLILAALMGAYLHFSAQGRYLFALGANEEGARFSGIRTNRHKLIAYTLCSLLTAFGGLLIAFKVNSLGPTDFGGFYELYAIAGAVLGGCSLRGGSGNMLGVVIGASLIVVLRNLVNILEIPSQVEYVVIGGAILTGVCIDELFARRRQRRA